MDKQHFENLIAGVKQMKAHMAGEAVKGSRLCKVKRPKATPIQPKLNSLRDLSDIEFND